MSLFFRAAPLVRLTICASSSDLMMPFPAHSSLGAFGTGAYSGLSLSSSVSTCLSLSCPVCLSYLSSDVYSYNFPGDRRPIKLLGMDDSSPRDVCASR
jgi:hypothetical protein